MPKTSWVHKIPAAVIVILPVVLVFALTKANAQLVVSQVYGGGGASTGSPPFRNDYIEIFNRGATDIELTGYSVQYASSAGATWSVTVLSGFLAPGQYYLVQESGGTAGSPLPLADVAGTIAMSASNGKIALVQGTTALTGACPTGPAVLDLVGYGSASCFEGTAPTPALSVTTAAVRNNNGCTDTNNNGMDFIAGTPSPHNTQSPTNLCGPVPIQLSSFECSVNTALRCVDLRWCTLTETNNYGFEVERKAASDSLFQTVAGSFVGGHGTTVDQHCYTFSDPMITPGTWYFRLRQIDLDGTVHHTRSVRLDVSTAVDQYVLPDRFLFKQNYPNPFNPSTTIEFVLPRTSRVVLTIHDMLGREIVTLLDRELLQGEHRVEWNSTGSPSGVYVCRMIAGSFQQSRKLVLTK
jgi:hypothetical protein